MIPFTMPCFLQSKLYISRRRPMTGAHPAGFSIPSEPRRPETCELGPGKTGDFVKTMALFRFLKFGFVPVGFVLSSQP